MTNPRIKLANAINTLKLNGFVVCAQSPSRVRLKRNENWVEIERDESSFLAYNLEGKEYFLDVDPEDLDWTVKFAVATF